MNREDVVLIGWAGSTERQLRLLRKKYESWGMRVHSAIPDIWRAMRDGDGWVQQGEALAARIDAIEDRGRVWFHLCSNAGFWTYGAALRALSDSVHVAGAVIDSAPGFGRHVDGAFSARYGKLALMPLVLGALGRKPELHNRYLDMPLWAFLRFWFWYKPELITFAVEALDAALHRTRWPTLLLYSSSDPIIPVEHVQSFRDALSRRQPVDEREFPNSGHVRHFIQHHKPYFRAVRSFVGQD